MEYEVLLDPEKVVTTWVVPCPEDLTRIFAYEREET